MRLVRHTAVAAVHKPFITAADKRLVASVATASTIEPSNVATSVVAATFRLATVVEVSFANMDSQLKDGHIKVMRIEVRHKLTGCTEELEE